MARKQTNVTQRAVTVARVACQARSRPINSHPGNRISPAALNIAHRNIDLLIGRRPSAAANPASVSVKHNVALVAATSAKSAAILAGSCRAEAAAR